MVTTFTMSLDWQNNAVDIWMDKGDGSKKVGKIPKGTPRATLVATGTTKDGREKKLFKYLLTPDFENKKMVIEIYDGALEIGRFIIESNVVDLSLAEQVIEK